MKVKSDKIEVEKRIRQIQEWILQDFITSDIIGNCVNRWGVTDRQAFRYLATANDGFVKLTEKNLEKSLSYHIQRRKKLIRDMDIKTKNTPAGTAAQLNIMEDIAKLEKLYTTKIELNGVVQHNVTTVIIEDPNNPESSPN